MDIESINKQYDSVSDLFNATLRGINSRWRGGQMDDATYREAGKALNSALHDHGSAESQIVAITAVGDKYLPLPFDGEPSFVARL